MNAIQALGVLLDLKCGSSEKITLSDAADGLSAANLDHSTHGEAQAARIAVEGDIRFWCDGTTATHTSGELISDTRTNPLMIFWSENLDNFSAINDTAGTDAVLNVQYFYPR